MSTMTTTEERRQALLEHAATHVEDFETTPMAALYMSSDCMKWRLDKDYEWIHIHNIKNIFMDLSNNIVFTCDYGHGDNYTYRVDKTVFNELAKKMFDEARGVDPNNPDEANFLPVSNFKR